MGGHGGLNILPQKRWNVYNYANREKVRRDEEAAAREEELKRAESRRRDAGFRLERLRQACGLSSSSSAAGMPSSDSRHINLFDGLADFSSLGGAQEEPAKYMKEEAGDGGSVKSKKQRREKRRPALSLEDEKYKLGYGLAGKRVKAPWYLSRPSSLSLEDVDEGIEGPSFSASVDGSGKKTIEELREERMRREKKEKERERAFLASVAKKGADRRFSRRRFCEVKAKQW